MRQPHTVTREFLRTFKAHDLVDVRSKHLNWSGPHKLLSYKTATPRPDAKPAAYIVIELEGKKLARWLVEGDQQIIRKHVRERRQRADGLELDHK